MTEDRVEWHLWNFANWERGGWRGQLAMPSRSGCVQVDHADFDKMVEEADRRCAEATGAVISALPANERAAVHAKHLETLWTLPERVLGLYYRSAVGLVGRGLDRRGIV